MVFTQVGSQIGVFRGGKNQSRQNPGCSRNGAAPGAFSKQRVCSLLMEPGKILEVLVTDPQIIRDLPSVLRQSNDQMIKVDQQQEFCRLYVRRGQKEKIVRLPVVRLVLMRTKPKGGSNDNTGSQQY